MLSVQSFTYYDLGPELNLSFSTIGAALLAFSRATAEMCAKAPCQWDASQHIFHLQVDNMFNLKRLQGKEASVFRCLFLFLLLGVCSFYLSTDLRLEPVSAVSGCWPITVKGVFTHILFFYVKYCKPKPVEKRKNCSLVFIVLFYFLFSFLNDSLF